MSAIEHMRELPEYTKVYFRGGHAARSVTFRPGDRVRRRADKLPGTLQALLIQRGKKEPLLRVLLDRANTVSYYRISEVELT